MFFLSNHQDVFEPFYKKKKRRRFFEPLCLFRTLIRELTYMGSRAKDKKQRGFYHNSGKNKESDAK